LGDLESTQISLWGERPRKKSWVENRRAPWQDVEKPKKTSSEEISGAYKFFEDAERPGLLWEDLENLRTSFREKESFQRPVEHQENHTAPWEDDDIMTTSWRCRRSLQEESPRMFWLSLGSCAELRGESNDDDDFEVPRRPMMRSKSVVDELHSSLWRFQLNFDHLWDR
jgi:hypothetical protein